MRLPDSLITTAILAASTMAHASGAEFLTRSPRQWPVPRIRVISLKKILHTLGTSVIPDVIQGGLGGGPIT
jgi:hypothetical protein